MRAARYILTTILLSDYLEHQKRIHYGIARVVVDNGLECIGIAICLSVIFDENISLAKPRPSFAII